MEVRYENGVEDLVAFNAYHLKHSCARRRMLWVFLLAVAGLVGLSLAMTWSQDGGLSAITVVVTVVPAVLVVAAACVLLPLVMRASIRWNVREGKSDSLVGPRTLLLNDEGVVERSNTGETLTRWTAVGPVVVDETHVFVYVSPVSAHAIPRSAFASAEELKQFVVEVECRTQRG